MCIEKNVGTVRTDRYKVCCLRHTQCWTSRLPSSCLPHAPITSLLQAPDGLKGILDHQGALFGRIPFGQSVTKNLYYTKRPLCNGQVPDTPYHIQKQGYFLLVDRGGCSFVEKVRNAQRDNATAVLIADNTCLCCSIEGSCATGEECEAVEPTMDDDGSGVDIKTPSLASFQTRC